MLAQYIAALALTTAVLLCAVVFVFFKGPPGRPTRFFIFLNLAIAFWSGTEAIAITLNDPVDALFLWRVSHIGVILIPILFFHFVVTSIELQGTARRFLRIGYGITLAWQFLNWTPWFLVGVTPKFSLRAYCDPAPLYVVFVGWWSVLVVWGLMELARASRRATGTRKTQLRYMFWGTIVAVVGGSANFFPTFGFEIIPWNPYGTYGVLLNALITSYALVNYRLLDVPLAITRSVLLVAISAVSLGIPMLIVLGAGTTLHDWLGPDWWFVPILTGVLLAVTGPFIYFYLQQRIEARFLGEQRAYQSVLLKASLGMTRVRNVQKLLRLIVGIVTRLARISHAALFLKNRHLHQYELAAGRHYRVLPSGARLPNEEAVVQWLRLRREPLVAEELRLQAARSRQETRAPEQLALQLDRLGIAVVVPSFIEEELFGFLVLGPKRSGHVYTTDDLDVFATLANQSALAIENAISFEELQRAQAQLFQAQKMGTLGQMASGMSHQIHNRLTVLSLAAQNARINVVPRLDDLLRRVVGLPTAVHQTMDELRRLYQVIEDESTRGSQIVRGLMEYSRPSSQQESVALKPLLEKAIEMLRYKHQLTSIQIIQDLPPDVPTILGNRSQLQDVFFNLLDNACDAVEEKQQQLERNTPLTEVPSFQGEIRIRAAVTQQARRALLQVTVADNGIGMSSEELTKLFIPFFTTKATSVKGTGLGLFIIQKIVEAHDGRIHASSEAGRGALFIVELPIG